MTAYPVETSHIVMPDFPRMAPEHVLQPDLDEDGETSDQVSLSNEWLFKGWTEKWPGTNFYMAEFNNAAEGETMQYTRGYLAMIYMNRARFGPMSFEQVEKAMNTYPGKPGDRGYTMF